MGKLTASFLIFLVSACAYVDIDKKAQGFDEEKYSQHLSECQGGNVVWGSTVSLGYAVIGGVLGAAEGVSQGAVFGNTVESVIIGASVGSVLGFGTGVYESYEKGNEQLQNCMRRKGYTVY